MPNPKPEALIELGTKVLIDLEAIQDRLTDNIYHLLKRNSSAKVIGYRMTDGNSIGLVLETNDGLIFWAFKDEVKLIDLPKDQDINYVKISKRVQLETLNKNAEEFVDMTDKMPVSNASILSLMNPLNFQKWLFYVLKDVI